MDLDGDLGHRLASLALDDVDSEPNAAEAVTLTTIHKAKGCEWRVVFIEAFKRTHSVEAVVASYDIPLQPSGQALVGRCPFHTNRLSSHEVEPVRLVQQPPVRPLGGAERVALTGYHRSMPPRLRPGV